MMVPDKVLDLVERFAYNLDAYKRSKYNETQVRREFIDPLFKCLGWDVDNEQGYAEAYKDVVHEDAIKVGRATKAPDYSFRIGGVRKFFVEAKKPSIDIKADTHPAYQLRRYAWSAKLPLSILTDFEEFAVYDCRIKPEKTDKASKARTLYLTYTDYAERWDELINIFSREAILKGSFDKYVESHKAKKGTAEVDMAFLQEIERWRDLLARNIALRNPRLTRRELNFAVQRTIDRIIFLRICEDRGIEDYGKLMALQNGAQVYERLLKLFYHADDRYNSGIFHFKTERGHPEAPDSLTPELQIDDKVLKDILKNLYYPDSPYEFSVLPADILGQVYEQFLGKVIRLTAGHQAKVEEKPEVKKAGGVYYTPTYIVEYIVKYTVGELLEGKIPKHVEKLNILDPACGSGSFLLGAYQQLLDWHRDYYMNRDQAKWTKGRRPRLYQNDRGEWKLTIEERKRILLNNIYGVDIDSQAVEVTKLSLLLKVLEGEDEQTLSNQLTLFQKRVLPDLSNNIKCGNSLIGSDFYEGKQLTWIDEEEMYRINAFDWEREFPEIMKKGGFDAVIGNPPYGALFTPEDKAYLKNAFDSIVGKFDSYGFFIEKGLRLLKNGGGLGYITPHTWLTVIEAQSLRHLILNEAKIVEIDRLPTKVFRDATVNTILIFLQKEEDEDSRKIHEVKAILFARDANLKEISVDYGKLNLFSQHDWSQAEASMFNIDISTEEQVLLRRIQETYVPLRHLCDFCVGVQAYDSHTGQNRSIIEERAYHSDHKKDKTYIRELNGKDVSRYYYCWSGEHWISYGTWLAHPRKPHFFQGERILVREITGTGCHKIHATFVDEDFINYKTILNVILTEENKTSGYNILYILGMINSALMSWYFPRASNKLVTKTFPRISILDLKRFPIRIIDFNNPTDKAHHDQMVEFVEQMLDLHKQLQDAKLPQAQTLLQRQIDATDRQIDRLVYELYGLTEEEIAIVEKG